MTTKTLDQWLSALYTADRKNQLSPTLDSFRAAIAADIAGLGAATQAKRAELREMIDARGEQACAFSTKYHRYLQDALQ